MTTPQTWFAGCMILLGGALGTMAQEPDPAMKKAIEAGKPGPHHRLLQPLAGDWDVTIQFKLDDQWNEGQATAHNQWILEGRFLQQQYQSNLFGQPFTVLQITGYDNELGKYFELSMDSMGTGVVHTEGSASDDGKTITNRSVKDYIDSETGKPARLRTVYKLIDANHYQLEWHQTVGDQPEQHVVTLEHRRRQEGAAEKGGVQGR